jgi:hypothetical protein
MRLKPETYPFNKVRLNWRSLETVKIEKEEVAWRLFNSAKLKAKRRGLDFNIKFGDVLRLVNKGACPVTGIPFDNREKPLKGPDLPFRASLDRMDNTRGYLVDNIMVVSKIYNHAKFNWNSEDVERMAQGIVSNIKRSEIP